MQISMSTNKAYEGSNQSHLEIVAASKGYTSSVWGTFNKIRSEGGKVRKGEKATSVGFWTEEWAENEDGVLVLGWVRKGFKVFNADQAEWPEGHRFAPKQAVAA